MSARHIIKNQKGLAQSMSKGFTLIELLVVIGILAVLLAITLIAINPARQFQQANDTKRSSDVNAILNAIDQYAADNKGALPTGISGCTSTACDIASGGAANTVDICSILVTKYLAALPTDPTAGSANGVTGAPVDSAGCTAAGGYDTKYTVLVSSSDNRVTVSATGQITNPITVTR